MLRRRKKRSLRNRPRNKKGRFLKLGARTRRKARRRRSSSRALVQRTSNPMRVMVANPGGLRRRRRRRRSVVRHVARRHPGRSHQRKPGRRRRGIRRASNPFRLNYRSAVEFAKGMGAGGSGIMAARAGAYLYTKYVAKYVKGAAGLADPKSARAKLSEFVRLVAMGVAVYALDTLAGKRIFGATTRATFNHAGVGEVGRQFVGLVAKMVKPDVNLDAYGLSGQYRAMARGEGGELYGLTAANEWVSVYSGAGEDLSLGRLVPRETFGDVDEDEEIEYVDEEQEEEAA